MVCRSEHAIFRLSVCNFVLLNNHFLLQDLDGVQFARRFFPAQNHFSKRPFAQHFQKLKAFQRDFPSSRGFGY